MQARRGIANNGILKGGGIFFCGMLNAGSEIFIASIIIRLKAAAIY
jgi:hypothetical protein